VRFGWAWHDAVALARARAQDPVVADEVEAGRRDQGRELLDELLGLEDDVGRAVAPAVLEPVEKPPVLHPREALGGDRRAGHVAAEALESAAIPGGGGHVRVQADTAHAGAAVAFERLVEGGARSPTSLRELRRYANDDGHWSWWHGRSVHGITYGDVEDWHAWLARRGISAKTQKNVSDAFRAFLHRLRRRGDVETIPEFPAISVPDHAPRTLDLETLEQILGEIPWEQRGGYLIAAYEALRVSEIRALDLADWDGRFLYVGRAIQGQRLSSPTRHTKNRSAGYREVWHPELLRWLEWRTGEGRRRAPFAQALAWNPSASNSDKRWTPDPMERHWHRACDTVGVSISLQEGTRHTILTAAGGVLPERLLRAFSRHRDGKSLGRYAQPRVTRAAMVRALPPSDE